MPKLNAKTAKAVEKTEGGTFAPVDPGIYHIRLRDVTAKPGPKGVYWAWEFESVEPDVRGRFWVNTSLSDAAHFKLKETFEAFGVEPNTDTDELLGKVVRGQVTITTIQKGPRTGELTNSLDKLLPPNDDFEVADSDAAVSDF